MFEKQKSLKLFSLRLLYSRRDLNPHGHNVHWILSPACLPIPPLEHLYWYGAKNGVRTRDLNLGKVALYQLSYFRVNIFSNNIRKCVLFRIASANVIY